MKFQDAIEEIKQRVPISSVIGEYVTLKRSGSNSMGLCPFHNEDTPSFSVNDARNMFHCFGCGKGGSVYTFLQEYLHISFREAVLMLAKRANIEIEDDFTSNNSYKINEEKRNKLYELHKDVANTYYKILYSESGKVGLDYLRSRKLTDATIKKFGLGFAPNGFGTVYKMMKDKGYDDTILFESKLFRLYDDKPCDTFYNRVMFPLVDIYKHVIGFQSRSLDPKPTERKYVNSEDNMIFHKKSFLYAMNYAYFSKNNYYILCEGNMDAITLHQSGFDNAIATMGTAFNENQMMLLKRKPKKIYLCQDTDDAGVKAIIESNKILQKANVETYVLDLKPSKDVDEFINTYGIEEFKRRVDNPIPTFLFIISSLKRKYNLEDPYELEKYINDIVEELAKVKNDFVRDNYIRNVALQEKLDAGILKNLLTKYLKGNRASIGYSDNVPTTSVKETEKEKQALSKLDSNFISLAYMCIEKRDDIKNLVSKDELINGDYQYIYDLYTNGKDLGDVYIEIEKLSDDKKTDIQEILKDVNKHEEIAEESKFENLNFVIRQIKIRTAKKESTSSLDSVFELNKKIVEINKKKYI